PSAPVPVGGPVIPSLGGAGAGAGAGSGLGSGSGLGGGGATFFGLAAEGRRFVYIVDKSGSMSTGWDATPGNLSVGRSSGDTRWRRAVAELLKSIAKLPTVARFQAYLYDSGLSSPPWNEDWVPAGSRGRSRVQNWVSRIVPGGGTQPVDAIQSALLLQPPPDAIFLLTDGEFPVEPALQVLQAMKAQGVRCPVHTVALGSQAGADTLRELSRITGGRTRVVK
ncbi:MAG: vWA domain-containing protein, partial [Phycisphaerales bacterium]